MCEGVGTGHSGGHDLVISVTDWLKELGLDQYAPAFRDNDIDGDILPELTADDLIGLGITSIGHRRKLLAAIAGLRETPQRRTAAQRTAVDNDRTGRCRAPSGAC